jgi:PX domain-containing protein kinase-like protein
MEISFNNAATRHGHTEYSIVVVKVGHKKQIIKRYSEMLSLHKKLAALGVPLPQFPPKKIFGNLKPDFVLRRQVALQDYFRKVIRVREVRQCLVFKQFIGFNKPKYPPFDPAPETLTNTSLEQECAMAAALTGCP